MFYDCRIFTGVPETPSDWIVSVTTDHVNKCVISRNLLNFFAICAQNIVTNLQIYAE